MYEIGHMVYVYEHPTGSPRRLFERFMGRARTMTSLGRVLIVDDDEDILFAGRLLLKRHFASVTTTNQPGRIPELMAGTDCDVILLDMNFAYGKASGKDGFHWLSRILGIDKDAVVILITAYGNVELAVEAMKQGATDFVSKPWHNEKLVATVHAALRLRQSRREASKLRGKNRELVAQSTRSGQRILGHSKAITRVLSVISRAAPTDANVLILGENGTGKELVAREIHQQSTRSDELFMSVDLGAIAESLFESELFGHKKGAFTDAREDRVGRFQAAHGGTLFLDEIANIPLHLQSKLLTVLEQRWVTPVGANAPVAIDVRVISATNIAPERLADGAQFRQDLLYRLNTVEVALPPLRERGGDIPLLTETFIAQYARKYGLGVKAMSAGAMAALEAYPWPGNIRALRHAVERAMIMSEGDCLEAEDFFLSGPTGTGRMAGAPTAAVDDHRTLGEIEKDTIARSLRKNLGNISHTAKDLGITRASLYRRMEKHGL